MSRWVRRGFNALTVLALLFCLLSAGMWVRSYYWQDMAVTSYVWLVSLRGELLLAPNYFPLLRTQYAPPDATDEFYFVYDVAPPGRGIDEIYPGVGLSGWKWGGFGVAHSDHSFRGLDRDETLVLVPYWIFFAVSALLPLYWLKKKRRRYPAGHCAVCGYDLRASPERCPECGMVAERAKA